MDYTTQCFRNFNVSRLRRIVVNSNTRRRYKVKGVQPLLTRKELTQFLDTAIHPAVNKSAIIDCPDDDAAEGFRPSVTKS